MSNSAPTVREVAEFVIKDLKHNWSAPAAEARYRRPLERRVFPTLGGKPVDQVTVDDCYGLVHPRGVVAGLRVSGFVTSLFI